MLNSLNDVLSRLRSDWMQRGITVFLIAGVALVPRASDGAKSPCEPAPEEWLGGT